MASVETKVSLPCTDDAPTGSSILILSMRGMETQAMIAPIVPISSASHDRYRKHPAAKITEITIMALKCKIRRMCKSLCIRANIVFPSFP
jgi:hypothetical protein